MHCRYRSSFRSKFWRRTTEEGRPGWQRIVVALIADGLGPMDTAVLDVLATLGCYQDGVLKKAVDEKPTVAHIFEVGSEVSIERLGADGSTPHSCPSTPLLNWFSPTQETPITWSVPPAQHISTSGACSDHLLPQAGERQEDQLSSMAVQCDRQTA